MRRLSFAPTLYLAIFLIINGLVSNACAETSRGSNTEFDYSTLEGRRAQLMEWADAKYKASDHNISKAYWILGDTAVNGCKAEYSNYMVDFKNHSNDKGKSVDHFILPAIVRYVYQFGECLSKQNIAVLRNFVAKGPCCANIEYLGHGTLNHAILQASSWYLLSQYFSDDTWIRKNRGEYTSKQIKETIYNNLQNRFSQTTQYGHFEIASPTYIEANFFPLLNLIDFSNDETIRSLAEGEAYKTLQYLRDYSFKGKLIPPLTRQLTNELNATAQGHEDDAYSLGLDKRLYWYYFGPTLDLTVSDFNNSRAPSIWIIYALSDWQPTDLYSESKMSLASEKIASDKIPTFSQWGEDKGSEIFSQKYIEENYALASTNIRYFPYWYTGNLVEFGILLDSDAIFNQIDCTQPYWYSNTSTDIDGKDKARWYDRSSPFMQTYLVDKHNMLFIANIPDKDPFTEYQNSFTSTRTEHVDSLPQFVRCRIPKDFDSIKKSDRVIQVQEGKSYVQIESLNQEFDYSSDDQYQYFILDGEKSAMRFFVTDDISSMSELTNRASQYTSSYSSTDNRITFTDTNSSRQIKMTFNNVLYKDSDSSLAEREIMYESIPIIEEVSQ